MKQLQFNLDLRSLSIGFFACFAFILLSAFGNPEQSAETRYEAVSGETAVVILDKHTGQFIYKEDLSVWVSGTFEDVHKQGRPAIRKK